MPSAFNVDANGVSTLAVAPTGDAGIAINSSLANLSTLATATTAAVALKAPIASPVFTGTVTAPLTIGNLTGTATNATTAASLTGSITESQVTNLTSDLAAINSTFSQYLPLEGGTMSGPIDMNNWSVNDIESLSGTSGSFGINPINVVGGFNMNNYPLDNVETISAATASNFIYVTGNFDMQGGNIWDISNISGVGGSGTIYVAGGLEIQGPVSGPYGYVAFGNDLDMEFYNINNVATIGCSTLSANYASISELTNDINFGYHTINNCNTVNCSSANINGTATIVNLSGWGGGSLNITTGVELDNGDIVNVHNLQANNQVICNDIEANSGTIGSITISTWNLTNVDTITGVFGSIYISGGFFMNGGNVADAGYVAATSSVVNSLMLNPTSTPSSPTAGQIYFNTSDTHFYGWNGTAWKQLDN